MGVDDPADQLAIKGDLPARPVINQAAADMIPAALDFIRYRLVKKIEKFLQKR